MQFRIKNGYKSLVSFSKGQTLLVLLVLSVLLLASGLYYFVPSPVIIGVAYSSKLEDRFVESKILTVARAYAGWYNSRHPWRKVRLVTGTYISDPTAVLGELKREGAVAVVGFSNSSAVIEALPGAAYYKLPLIGVSGITSSLSKKDDWYFRVHPSVDKETYEIGNLLGALDISSIGLVSFSDNPSYLIPFRMSLLRRGEPEVVGEVDGSRFIRSEPVKEGLHDVNTIVIVGPTSYSLWAGQVAHSLWPSGKIIFSGRSAAGVTAAAATQYPWDYTFYGVDTFYPPLIQKGHPFVAYWENRFALQVDGIVNSTYLAMTLVLQALEDSGFQKEESLRRKLAEYRKIQGLGGFVEIDKYGDAHGQYVKYSFGPQGYKEVVNHE